MTITFKALRQSSVIRVIKNIWGEQKTPPKKGLHPKLRPMDPGLLPPFGAQFSLGGKFTAWWGAKESYGADLSSSPQIQGRKILRFFLAFTRVFRPGTKLSSCLGVQAIFWGAQALKCTPVA